MSSSMRAYLIDPHAQTITQVDHDGDYKQLYRLLSTDAIKVDIFQAVRMNEAHDSIFIDEEGLLKDAEQQRFFEVSHEAGWGAGCLPLAGRGVVLGVDDNGDSTAPRSITLEQLRARIRFPQDRARLDAHRKEALAESGQVIAFDSTEDMHDFLRSLHRRSY